MTEAPLSLGGYEILETVAVGRSTILYRGRRSPGEPTVLIKALKPGLAQVGEPGASLAQEGERLQALRHPLWPTLLRRIDGPNPALVLVDHGGQPLSALLRRSPRIDPLAATAIAIEVARGAAALHRLGHAHGAFEPDLVELTAAGGVCLRGRLDSSANDELTAPQDMAPEQIAGDPPDAKSDIFLLGALTYRMLCGRWPNGRGPGGASRRARHATAPPIRRFARDVPPAIERVVLRCLAQRRHDRLADMGTVAARLIRALRLSTSLPLELLIAGAIAKAGLAEPTPIPLDRDAARGSRTQRLALGWRIAAAGGVAAAMFGLVFAWRTLSGPSDREGASPQGIVERPAYLRVLARPWAEVYLDGKLVDVTPIGFPIEVRPGRHSVALRHPSAPEEVRTVEVTAGETALIDVDMAARLAPARGSGGGGNGSR